MNDLRVGMQGGTTPAIDMPPISIAIKAKPTPKQNELVEAKLEWGYFQQIGVGGGGDKNKLLLEGTKAQPYVTAGDTGIVIEAKGIIIDLSNGTKIMLKASNDDASKLVIAAFKDGKMLSSDLKVADGAGAINIPMGEGKGEASMSLKIEGGRIKGFTIDTGDGAILSGKSNGGDNFNMQKIDNATFSAPKPPGAQQITIDTSGGIEVKIGLSAAMQEAMARYATLQGEGSQLSNNEYSQQQVGEVSGAQMQKKFSQQAALLSIQLG